MYTCTYCSVVNHSGFSRWDTRELIHVVAQVSYVFARVEGRAFGCSISRLNITKFTG